MTPTMIACEFCGHLFPAENGRYGCANCHGEGLAVNPGSLLANMRWSKPDADRDQPREAGKLGGRPTLCGNCGDCKNCKRRKKNQEKRK